MRTPYILAACLLVLAFTAVPAMGAGANAGGQCYDSDAHADGGEGSVSADTEGNVDAVDAAEAQSIAAAVTLFVTNFGDNAASGSPGDDACPNTDDDNGDGTEEDEDGIWASAYRTSEVGFGDSEIVGACYDDEGFHATARCHNGGAALLP